MPAVLQLTGSVRAYPARALVAGYLILIALGTLLLMTPLSHSEESAPWQFSDAAFTATSAACVTGLVVRSTPNDFTFFGQTVILLLIQFGGLGIMTFATLATTALRGGASLRDKAVTTSTLGDNYHGEAMYVLKRVLVISLSLELVCALALAFCVPGEHILERIWWGLFHSVSAFCNAGFALQDDSLIPFQHNAPICLIISMLIIVGGLGFPVLWDIGRRVFGKRQRAAALTFHTKVVLSGTVGLLVFGFVSFMLLERENYLADLSLSDAVLASFFQSVTARTAGFNTVPLNQLTVAGLFTMALLMYVGAGPCSTGGGLKVSTFMVLLLEGRSLIFSGTRSVAFRRSIGQGTLIQAVTAAFLYGAVAIVGLIALLFVEEHSLTYAFAQTRFLDAVFEVTSALGTVGLSTGLTPELSEPSRWIIMALMFIGRVGPLSLVIVLSSAFRPPRLRYPEGEIIIA